MEQVEKIQRLGKYADINIGATVVQWDRVRFVGPRVLKRTGSNPGHGPRLGRASTRGNGSQMPKPKSS
ncbi:hypothetical protein E2C01_048702 [Portunus trituberculatus]|uniref:Uncharacterized protein n=1 Tax=Portunus trituberculatus TaxID=210409 RepID=A0A5B7GB89_PORTR|nr:hypothetical protein [Portunus trituberculatus]